MITSLRSHLIALAAISGSVYVTPVLAQTVPECPGQLPSSVRLPDLVNMVPHHIHVQEQQKQSRLMFTVGIANVGQGPTELAPAASLSDPNVLVTANQNVYAGPTNQSGPPVCKRSLADAFLFHPEHNHWHLIGVNGFEVRRALDDGSRGNWDKKNAIGSLKESFCLIDFVKMNDDQLSIFGITLPPREYFDCQGVHGISRGWVDTYHHATHGQFVDITGAPAGLYYLVVTANPLKLFLESNYENNRVWVSFRLEYNNTNNAIVTVLFNSFDQVREGIQAPSGTNR
jgi:Lysyl oxidase